LKLKAKVKKKKSLKTGREIAFYLWGKLIQTIANFLSERKELSVQTPMPGENTFQACRGN
jgi:hypothetical protein